MKVAENGAIATGTGMVADLPRVATGMGAAASRWAARRGAADMVVAGGGYSIRASYGSCC